MNDIDTAVCPPPLPWNNGKIAGAEPPLGRSDTEAPAAGRLRSKTICWLRFSLPCHPKVLADLQNSTVNSEQPVTASHGFDDGGAK